jgi:hypothetical protein
MRKITKWAVFFLLPFLFYSCSVITSAQKEAISEFATSASDFSKMPRQVFDMHKETMLKHKMMAAIRDLKDTSAMINTLDISIKEYTNTEKFTSELETTFKLIEKYSTALGKLVNVDIEGPGSENLSSLGKNIDTLIKKSKDKDLTKIPIGFGAIAAKIVSAGGLKKLKHKQLVLAREFIGRGDSLIIMAASVLSDFAIELLVLIDANDIINNENTKYRAFLKKLDPTKISVWDLYKDINPKYIDIQISAFNTLQIAGKLQKASAKIIAAHAELKALINKKDSETILGNIASFATEIIEARDLLKKINEDNKKILQN